MVNGVGWHAGGPGAWDDVRSALQAAGNPRLLVSDCAPAIAANLSVSKVRVSPELLLEGDVPRLTATVTLQGAAGAAAKAALHFDGQLVDTQSVQFTEAGDADAVFHLPALKAGPHAGWIELEHDALPADDRSYFVLRPAESIPVLVVSGQVSSIPFESSGTSWPRRSSPRRPRPPRGRPSPSRRSRPPNSPAPCLARWPRCAWPTWRGPTPRPSGRFEPTSRPRASDRMCS